MTDDKAQRPQTGAEDVRWDLDDLYAAIDDPQIDTDLDALVKMAEAFNEAHAGKLVDTLGAALEAKAQMSTLATKLMLYLHLRRSTAATDPKIQQQLGKVFERWSMAEANHLNFFEHELVAIDDATFAKILERDDNARRHKSMLDHIRANRQYLLEESIERALTLRGPFGPSEWGDYVEELEAELRFSFDDREQTLPEILHVISNDTDADRRSAALEAFSKGMTAQRFDKVMARVLNVTIGAKNVDDGERGYARPMTSRNIGNRVDDDTVEALHEAVADLGAQQCRRYYALASKHLKIAPLKWSDRNAKMPFADTRTIPWNECVETVLSAYESFSPTLRDRVKTMLDRKWVDAPPYEGKTGGAYNFSVLLPNGEARAYNFLNYLGATRDVMTVAHEVGHGVHGMLAAEAQGALMFRAPMAYAETASIFGEMTTFKYLLERTETDEQRLALLMEKSSDHINTVVRQISFSNFERKIHDARKNGKLTADDYNAAWMEVTHAFYGEEGDLFTYDNTANLWAYVTHFLRPFYVYAYAFGELFTQSLFAVQNDFGADFEGMYLDLLRAGGSKSAVELMKPFGLDPRDPSFWRKGIEGSVKTWLDEAEAITAKMG